MKKIISVISVCFFCAAIFFGVASFVGAQSVQPRFLTAQLFRSPPFSFPPPRLFLGIQVKDVEQRFKGYSYAGPEYADGDEDYPNPNQYTDDLVKIILDKIPPLKNPQIRITQLPHPGNPTSSKRILYGSRDGSGDFVHFNPGQQKSFDVTLQTPLPGGKNSVMVEVRGKNPLICYGYWCPSGWQVFSGYGSIISDTGKPNLSIQEEGITTKCYPSRWGTSYLVTVPVWIEDNYYAPNRAASGINRIELDGGGVLYDSWINQAKTTLSFIISQSDFDRTFTAKALDNVGHESGAWGFQIPREGVKSWCNDYDLQPRTTPDGVDENNDSPSSFKGSQTDGGIGKSTPFTTDSTYPNSEGY